MASITSTQMLTVIVAKTTPLPNTKAASPRFQLKPLTVKRK
jgi:hypothetical protein